MEKLSENRQQRAMKIKSDDEHVVKLSVNEFPNAFFNSVKKKKIIVDSFINSFIKLKLRR